MEVSEVRNEPPSSPPPMMKTTKTDAEATGDVSERGEGELEQAKDDGGATAADLCVMSMNEEEEGESEGEGEEDEYSDCDPNQFCEISMDSKLEVRGSTIEYRIGWSCPVRGFYHNPQTGVVAVHH